MEKVSRIKLLLAILFLISVLIYFLIVNKIVKQKSHSIEVKGVIKEMNYDEKGYPSIIINDRNYNLPCANNGKLQIGDSIVKYKNSDIVYQYRNNSNIHSYECGLGE